MNSARGQSKIVFQALAMTLMLFAAWGCSGRPKNIARKVTGKVTLGGQPLAGALVIFTPKEAGSPSSGKTDQNGNYNLIWARHQRTIIEGAQIGEHVVTITTLVEGAPSAKPPRPEVPEKVPFKYRQDAQPTATVNKGANTINFDLEPGPVEPPPPPSKGKAKGKAR